jgi:hypothetical protein
MKKILLFTPVLVLALCSLAVAEVDQGLGSWLTPDGWSTRPMTKTEIIDKLKSNIIYFRHHNRCFAAIPYTGSHWVRHMTITQVNCTDDIQ